MMKRTVKKKTRRVQAPARSTEHDELIKALIVKGFAAFEESFRRQYPEASQEEIRDHMTRSCASAPALSTSIRGGLFAMADIVEGI